jgi:hypothetical protein
MKAGRRSLPQRTSWSSACASGDEMTAPPGQATASRSRSQRPSRRLVLRLDVSALVLNRQLSKSGAVAIAQEQPLAVVEPGPLLCKAIRARSSSVSALSRWTTSGTQSSLSFRGQGGARPPGAGADFGSTWKALRFDVSSERYDRVVERRRAVALARHFRESEGLSIAQIAERLGRSRATVKAYFYDPTGERARAVKARYVGVCRGCGAHTQPRNVRFAGISCEAGVGARVIRVGEVPGSNPSAPI